MQIVSFGSDEDDDDDDDDDNDDDDGMQGLHVLPPAMRRMGSSSGSSAHASGAIGGASAYAAAALGTSGVLAATSAGAAAASTSTAGDTELAPLFFVPGLRGFYALRPGKSCSYRLSWYRIVGKFACNRCSGSFLLSSLFYLVVFCLHHPSKVLCHYN